MDNQFKLIVPGFGTCVFKVLGHDDYEGWLEDQPGATVRTNGKNWMAKLWADARFSQIHPRQPDSAGDERG